MTSQDDQDEQSHNSSKLDLIYDKTNRSYYLAHEDDSSLRERRWKECVNELLKLVEEMSEEVPEERRDFWQEQKDKKMEKYLV